MSHHEPFKSLSPLSWADDIAPRDPSSLAELFTSTLANAELLINSIPTPTPPTDPSLTTTTTSGRRPRSHTDSSVPPPLSPSTDGPPNARPKKPKANSWTKEEEETRKKLAREWKDVKTPANPHGITMHKLASRDGKGAWFARRSLHRGEPFAKWEAALRREMADTLGMGKGVRGLGAERRVADVGVGGGVGEGGEGGIGGGKGGIEVYQVAVRFPGPTTPRDFVTLLMMPESEPEGDQHHHQRKGGRQFMIVSRPCEHPDCPPRGGFIRGQYESVELVREVPVEKPLRRTRSSVDLGTGDLKGGGDGEHVSREAILRAAKKAVGEGAESEGEQAKAVSFARSAESGDDDTEMAIEWLMITRSDPGGSVPRFMVEKGTPGGVINDAGRFLKWLSSQSLEDLKAPRRESGEQQEEKLEEVERSEQPPTTTSAHDHDHLPNGVTDHHHEELPPASGTGIYGLITSALGAASSAVANRVAAFAPSSIATDSDDDSDDESASSEASFASAEEGEDGSNNSTLNPNNEIKPTSSNTAADNASTQSTHSTFSETLSRSSTPASHAQAHHEKELRKLQQRMHKAQEKLERVQARRLLKRGTKPDDEATATKDKKEDDAALAKLRDKHARELAKQQDKYERELARLADKRAAEERKAAERRRKAAEREEKGDLQMELERVKAERDVARKEVEMLRERIGELQGQNTMLVARLGREGIVVKPGEVGE